MALFFPRIGRMSGLEYDSIKMKIDAHNSETTVKCENVYIKFNFINFIVGVKNIVAAKIQCTRK